MPAYSRFDERIKVIQSLYQVFAFDENKVEYDATNILCSIYEVDDINLVPDYSKYIYTLSLEHLNDIIDLINTSLNKWNFSRLDNVAKAILVLGTCEGNYTNISNKKIIIDSSVRIAKMFLKFGDYKYINAVLYKIIK